MHVVETETRRGPGRKHRTVIDSKIEAAIQRGSRQLKRIAGRRIGRVLRNLARLNGAISLAPSHNPTFVGPQPIHTDRLVTIRWRKTRADVDGQTRQASNTVESAPEGQLQFIFHSPDDAEVTAYEGISGDGDSGGPALIATEDGWAVAGLSSYQDKNGSALGTYGVLEVYTRVSDHTDWIKSGLNGDLEADDPKGCASAGSQRAPIQWLALLLPLMVARQRRADPMRRS